MFPDWKIKTDWYIPQLVFNETREQGVGCVEFISFGDAGGVCIVPFLSACAGMFVSMSKYVSRALRRLSGQPSKQQLPASALLFERKRNAPVSFPFYPQLFCSAVRFNRARIYCFTDILTFALRI